MVEGIEFAQAGSVGLVVATEVLRGQRGVVAAVSVVAARHYGREHLSGSPARKEGPNPCSPFEGIPWEDQASLFWGVRCRSDQTMEHSGGKEEWRGCLRVVDLAEGSLLEGKSSTKPLASTLGGTIKNGSRKSKGTRTHCFKYSRLRALLFGSRPGGGLPRRFVPCGPFVRCPPAQVFGLLLGFEGGFPFGWPPDIRSWGKAESMRRESTARTDAKRHETHLRFVGSSPHCPPSLLFGHARHWILSVVRLERMTGLIASN